MSDKELDIFNPLLKEITDFVSSGSLIKVDSIESCGKALLSAKQVKLLEKAVEERRKEIVGPLNDRVKQINGYAKTFLEPLLKAEAQIKTELISWEKTLEKEREEQKRIAEEKHRQEQEELEAVRRAEAERTDIDSFFGGDDDESLNRISSLDAAAEGLKEAQKEDIKEIEANKVRGSSSFVNFKIIDEELVPREFCEPVPGLIREAIKRGRRKISGVEIFQDVRIAIR